MSHLSSLSAYTSNVPFPSAPNSILSYVVSKWPELRNAAQYYAHDARALTWQLVGGSAETATAAACASSDSAAANVPAESTGEVHYCAVPASPMNLSIQRVRLCPMDGGMVLLLSFDRGFGVFDVSVGCVSEIVVDTSYVHGPVVDLGAVDRRLLVTLSDSVVARYHITPAKKSSVGPVHALNVKATDLRLLRHFVAILAEEFSQLILLRHSAEGFVEERVILTDGSVVASSTRWLAYCGHEKGLHNTFLNTRADSTAETVVKGVTSGLSRLFFRTSPHSGPAATPLGSVVVTDVEDGEDFASFCPHNHVVKCMQFDASGTLLATASSSGTSVAVFQVMRGSRGGGEPAGVVLLYRLWRGMTSGVISSMDFAPGNAAVAVGTSIGTVHIFAVPDAVLAARGTPPPTYAAPTLRAALRCRAAPTATPVTPAVAFAPLPEGMGGAEGEGGANFALGIASSSAVVSCIEARAVQAASGVATLLYSSALDTFVGPREASPLDSARSTEGKGEERDRWRGMVEFAAVDDIVAPFGNFWFEGAPLVSAEVKETYECVFPGDEEDRSNDALEVNVVVSSVDSNNRE